MIKRNEEVEIKLIVSNYRNVKIEATIYVNQSDQFQIGYDTCSHQDFSTKITIDANSVMKVPVFIKPVVLGKISFTCYLVNDDDSEDGDAVQQPIDVEAEGRVFYANKAILVQQDKPTKYQEYMVVKDIIGEDRYNSIVNGSMVFQIQVIGNPLGTTLSNLDQLIRLPVGCGEQNLLIMSTSVYVATYLKIVNQLTAEVKVKAETYAQTGYERQLGYQLADDGFSAFPQDTAGSTWLTAFTVQVRSPGQGLEVVLISSF